MLRLNSLRRRSDISAKRGDLATVFVLGDDGDDYMGPN